MELRRREKRLRREEKLVIPQKRESFLKREAAARSQEIKKRVDLHWALLRALPERKKRLRGSLPEREKRRRP